MEFLNLLMNFLILFYSLTWLTLFIILIIKFYLIFVVFYHFLLNPNCLIEYCFIY